MDQEKLGRFIASCRRKQGMTQAALAERLGITDRAVSKWDLILRSEDLFTKDIEESTQCMYSRISGYSGT